MKTVYVMGAYSGYGLEMLENMRVGIEISRKVLDAGFAPFCPFLDYHFALLAPGMTIEKYYAYSMAWLERSDACLLIPGWQSSKGTWGEIAKAIERKIPIFDSIEELKANL